MHLMLTEDDAFFKPDVKEWYGSMARTMLTLFQCTTGGVDWHIASRPLGSISLVFVPVFSFYIAFVVIGVLNVLTGIFVERASQMSGLDRDLIVQGQLNRDQAFFREMKTIFVEADLDNSGTVSWEELSEYLMNEEVRAYLAAQQLDSYDARQLFNILDVDGTREIGMSDFVLGLWRLRGMAKSVDMVALLMETRALNIKMREFMAETTHTLTKFKRDVSVQSTTSSMNVNHLRTISIPATVVAVPPDIS